MFDEANVQPISSPVTVSFDDFRFVETSMDNFLTCSSFLNRAGIHLPSVICFLETLLIEGSIQ